MEKVQRSSKQNFEKSDIYTDATARYLNTCTNAHITLIDYILNYNR